MMMTRRLLRDTYLARARICFLYFTDSTCELPGLHLSSLHKCFMHSHLVMFVFYRSCSRQTSFFNLGRRGHPFCLGPDHRPSSICGPCAALIPCFANLFYLSLTSSSTPPTLIRDQGSSILKLCINLQDFRGWVARLYSFTGGSADVKWLTSKPEMGNLYYF